MATVRILILFLVIVIGTQRASLAGSIRLEGLQGDLYKPATNVEVAWAATNELPQSMWVYKALAQTFTMAQVSNMVSLCGFHWNQLSKKPDSRTEDKNQINFKDDSKLPTKHLTIAPALGWMDYYSDGIGRQSTNGVPSREEAEQIGLDYLNKLGIDRSLVINEHRGTITLQGNLAKDGTRLTTNIVGVGVDFSRNLNGYPLSHRGSFSVTFEHDQHITRMQLNWRNLAPNELHTALSKDEMMQLIKDGQSQLPEVQSADTTDIEKASKLTIKNVNIVYFDDRGYKLMDRCYPFAIVTLTADISGKESTTFFLQCPIIK